MSKFISFRTLAVSLLFALTLAAGIVGGIDCPPDVALVGHFQTVRASSPGLTLAAIAITQAGSAAATFGGGMGIAAWLFLRRDHWRGALLGATVAGSRVMVDGLKLMIDRTRPTFDLHPVATHSSSFPSGHSGNTMAVFLAVALIAVPRAYRISAVGVALVGSFIVGATRPYLGVHWPSDVIGGWALGAGLAIIAWTIADTHESRPAK